MKDGQPMDVKICCSDMKEFLVEGIGYQDGYPNTVVSWNESMSEGHMLFNDCSWFCIRLCPFCGKKVEYVEGGKMCKSVTQ